MRALVLLTLRFGCCVLLMKISDGSSMMRSHQEDLEYSQELFLIHREGIGLPIRMDLHLFKLRLMQITEFSL